MDPSDWTVLNHWLTWAKGCLRMVTYVSGASRYVFQLKGTDPVDGAYIATLGVGPNLLSAANDLLFNMQKHLTDPTFRRTLTGAAGGENGGRGGETP